MNVYIYVERILNMSGNYLDACFMRLVQNLKQSAKNGTAVTLMIGAGCSLTSSQKDVTTYGIIKSLVRDHSMSSDISENWNELYMSFVNNVWEGQGERNRIQLLQDYFTDMTPSVGYQAMRWLVENGYINNIITTNFDLMIDTALEGLSYQLVVGSHEEIVGTNPKPALTLIKAHGDLRFGELRFAPDQLAKLPKALRERICSITSGTVIVVGYRGQDIGILNALNDSGDYNAYWASPVRPDELNSYETGAIYTWMKKRNSANNFLSGERYGYFDKLLTQIKERLIKLSKDESLRRTSRFHELWKKSPLFDYLHLNRRFLEIYEQLHCYLETEVQTHQWRITDPYCACNHEVLLKAILDLMQENTISSQYLDCIANEVDALVFSLSCSIWTLCQGYPWTAAELVHTIRMKFEEENQKTRIGEEFWNAVLLLSQSGLGVDIGHPQIDNPLSFYFDKNGNFRAVLMRIDLRGMYYLLSNIFALLLFVPTCENGSERLMAQKNKKTLEKHLYEIRCYDSIIRLQMSKISLTTYHEVYQMLQQYGFSQTVIENEYILSRDIIRVSFSVEKTLPDQKESIWEKLVHQTQQNCARFFHDFAAEQFVPRQHMSVFSDFLQSPSNGLLIIGDSGSGKTTTLKLWLSELDPSEYLIYPILGRDNMGQEIQSELGEATKLIPYIEIMLEQRYQSLIIVFDAINEIRGTFADIAVFYKELLAFCNELTRESCGRIKLVISCRSDFYVQLKKSVGVEPSSSSFYTLDTPGGPQSLYQFPLLNDEEIGSFISLYQPLKKHITIEKLRQKFGELIYLPINLNIICNAYGADSGAIHTAGQSSIYKTWFHCLTVSAKKDAISEETLWAVVFQTVHYLFFDSQRNEAQTHRLSIDLSTQYPKALAAFEWLVLHKVFLRNGSDPNLIQFSHDSLEEFFLSQYILKRYADRLSTIDRILTSSSLSRPTVKHGLRIVFLTLFQDDRLAFINSLVSVVRDNNDQLLPLWIDAMLQVTKNASKDTLLLLRELEQYLLKREFSSFLRATLLHVHQMLNDMDDPGIVVVDSLAEAVLQSNICEDPTLKILSNHLRSKQRYLFPGENDTKAFRDSLALCEQTDHWFTNTVPVSLKDEHQMQKALLLQNQGQLNEAIDLMEECYKRQVGYVMYDLACQSALYLGAMYREMTRFDDAIDLYNTVEIDMIETPLLRYRLLMNKGIIYKNKIQNALFLGQKATEENLQYYQKALDNFAQTCDYAEQSDDIQLQLEIYAERVELGCAAYYLDLGTIKEATSWVKKIDKLIPRYYVPVERIQRHRMWARVLVLERRFTQAIEHLEHGFEIAVNYNIPFRATDCCNQITGIICDMIVLESFSTKEILEKGLHYGRYAIDYYKKLNRSDHRYLQDSLKKYRRIEEAYQAFVSKA